MIPPTTIELMKHNIRSYNRYITMTYLDTLTPMQLLHNVHETDRLHFVKLLRKENLVTSKEVDGYIKHQ